MSCEKPLNLVSNAKVFNPSVTPIYNNVPCGKCDSCRSELRNEWYVRSYYQYKGCHLQDGKTLFITLTYRPTNLPMFVLDSHELVRGERTPGAIPVFYKKDKDKFMKSLRKWFERKNLKGITYLWCCEYGTDVSKTQRPHYHILLFIPHWSSACVTLSQVLKQIKALWEHGYVIISKKEKGGMEVSSFKGIRYVSKYCAKDINFFKRKDVKDFLDSDPKNKEFIKPYLPKHWQSHYFGFAMLDECQNLNDVRDLYFDGVRIKEVDKMKPYPLPRYIKNSLLHGKLPLGQSVINDIAVDFQTHFFFSEIDRSVFKFTQLFSTIYLGSYLRPEDYKKLDLPNVLNAYTLNDYVYKLLDDRTFDTFAFYKKCFQNRTYIKESNDYLHVITPSSLGAYALEMFKYQQCHKLLPDIPSRSRHKPYPCLDPYDYSSYDPFFTSRYHAGFMSQFTYNHFPIFRDFDHLDNIISKLRTIIRKRKIEVILKGEHDTQVIRDMYTYGVIHR